MNEAVLLRVLIWAGVICCLCGMSARLSASNVVINELCYDPDGTDSGHEWIELYNAGEQDVNLEGALILSGGSSFNLVYELPHFIMRAHRFLLIGEQNVASAVLITPLGFQNGGSETDGVRFVSPDGSYTDTVLYDSPNNNDLPDDTGSAGDSFAPDVSEGYSLARIIDGADTNACEADFFAEQNPTPGLANHVYVDYALLYPQTWQEDTSWRFGCWVKNLSSVSPSVTADLSIKLDGVLVAAHIITDLAAGDSLQFIDALPVTDTQNHLVEAVLEYADDPDTSNNSVSIDLFQQESGTPVINEVMYDPAPGKQEWIEIFMLLPDLRGDYVIKDASDNHFSFSLPSNPGYYVLCSSASALLSDYPQCPASAVIEVTGWASLNNTGDSIYLYDSEEVCLDQMSYVGGTSQQGKSLERYLNSTQQVSWRYCLDAAGATPGRMNSQSAPVPDFNGSLKLAGSPCNPKNGETISLYYKLDKEQSRVNCYVFDRAGHRVRILADDLVIPEEGAILWDGKDTGGSYVSRGLYFIVWESRPSAGGKVLSRQFSLVIYN